MKNVLRLSMTFAISLVLVLSGARAWAAPPRVKGRASNERAMQEPARASLEMDLRLDPKATGIHVGQAFAVTIRAYFLGGTGVTVNGQPRMTSDALLLSELAAEPRQTSVQIHGLPYTALSWTGVLTAVKAGQTAINIELPVALTYREAPRMPSVRAPGPGGMPGSADDPEEDGDDSGEGAGNPFASLLRQTPFASDPFFAQMFKGHDPMAGMFEDLAGAVRRRDVTLRDSKGSLKVLDLPAPRPPEFSGAVGTFEIAAALPDETFRVGEPTTLQVTVRGKGSFSRLSISGLPATGELGTYGVTSAFTAGPTPLAGEKVFSQTIVPRHAGALTVPSSTLTYFDPREGRYVTRRTAAMRISVAGANAAPGGEDATEPALGASQRAEAAPAGGASRSPSPIALSVPDVVRATLTPPFRARWFWGLVTAIGLVAVAFALVGRTYRGGALGRAVASRRLQREIAAQRRQIGAAASRGDAATLFEAGRRALQARLGAAWNVPAGAIATADVVSRLGTGGERIRDVFECADRLSYAGGSPAATADPRDPRELKDWQRLIFDELRTLEVRT